MCCLRYEHEFYVTTRRRFPKEGKAIRTSKGEEKVMSNDLFRERVTLRAEDGEARTVTLAELRAELDALGLPFPAPGGPPPKSTTDETEDLGGEDGELEENAIAVADPVERRQQPRPQSQRQAQPQAQPQAREQAEQPEQTGERRRGRRRGRRGGRRGRGGSGGGQNNNGGGAPPSGNQPPQQN
jgi:uncharacterized membrane protein YgcG